MGQVFLGWAGHTGVEKPLPELRNVPVWTLPARRGLASFQGERGAGRGPGAVCPLVRVSSRAPRAASMPHPGLRPRVSPDEREQLLNPSSPILALLGDPLVKC